MVFPSLSAKTASCEIIVHTRCQTSRRPGSIHRPPRLITLKRKDLTFLFELQRNDNLSIRRFYPQHHSLPTTILHLFQTIDHVTRSRNRLTIDFEDHVTGLQAFLERDRRRIHLTLRLRMGRRREFPSPAIHGFDRRRDPYPRQPDHCLRLRSRSNPFLDL